MLSFAIIDAILRPVGMFFRGGLLPDRSEGVSAIRETIVLVGNAGPAMWRAFCHDVGKDERCGADDPLDTWTRRALTPVAACLGARVVFPFDGPPFRPFQRWAMRAEGLATGPTGMLIHPAYGSWHAYRAALVFSEVLALPEENARPVCAGCVGKPCLIACPARAIDEAGPNVSRCERHLRSDAGQACLENGCLARDACPVGRSYRYSDEQVQFHMHQFIGGSMAGREPETA